VLAFLLLAAPLMGISGFLAQRSAAGEQARIAFSAANNLYTTGQYPLAQQAYRQMQSQGVESVELLYNLALTQLQLNDGLGAVETLQQAQRLAPRDARILALLDHAESIAAGQGATISLADAPLLPLQQSEIALVALILWTVAGALAVMGILTRRSALRILCFGLAGLGAIGALVILILG
jgi:tetratricopeptide (TPR) repeat protein